MQGQKRHVRQVLDGDSDLHGLGDGGVPRERRVAIHEDAWHIQGREGVFLETLYDYVACFPFVGIAGDFGAGEFARDGNFAGKIVGVRGAEIGDRTARLGEGGGVAAVRVHDPGDLLKREVETAMRGRIRRRREFAFNLFAREVDEDHIGGTKFFERYSAGFDGKNAATAVEGRSVAKSEMNQAMARESEVRLVSFAFKFGEHVMRLVGLCGALRVGSEVC